MEKDEGDREITKYLTALFNGELADIRETVADLLQSDRSKTEEINILTSEVRVKHEALERIRDNISVVFVSVDNALAIRQIAQKALDWKATENE